ncbi:MAG: hypothetical protein DRH04_06140, partial [Deltaproteobacteria bacterium]
LSDLHSGVDSANQGASAGKLSGAYNLGTTASPVSLTSTNVTQLFVDCATVLSEQKVPMQNRWILIPPAVENLLLKSDIIKANEMGDDVSELRKGVISRNIAGFKVYRTTLLPRLGSGSDVDPVLFGRNDAVLFGLVLTENEILRSEKTFANIARGLQLFGKKVIRPEALGVAMVQVS